MNADPAFGGKRGQASIDLVISYSIAILIISIAIYIVLQLGVFNSALAPEYCNSAYSFVCGSVTLNGTGQLIVVFSQSTGGIINITGAACSSAANSTIFGPSYGNVHVLSYSAAPQYYPNNALQKGLLVYSSNQTVISVNCYTGSSIAKGIIGNSYTGIVWINYTFTNLPPSSHTIQQLAAFSTKYASRP
jgi:hypothetical protein